jgi:DNA topoisomerase-1
MIDKGLKKQRVNKGTEQMPQVVETTDPQAAAKAAKLRYVTDSSPGITRQRRGKGFSYTGPDGQTVRGPEERQRIRSLAIPPAWKEVWICPHPSGHLQATGRDDKGRKQYRYHPRWRLIRDETKYGKMVAFGEALPKIRERVERDLGLPGLPREKVLATIVRLLEITLIRVGNDAYAQENKSYGLTTMRDRHAKISGSKVTFEFRGKSGIKHHIRLSDRRLAKIVKRCKDLPGYELFQYLEDGERRTVDSADVNDYLRGITAEDFTAKDFRTWAGTVLATLALREFETFDSQTQAKKNIVQAIEHVAKELGNTPAICRKCYVHPEVIDAYLSGSLAGTLQQRAEQELKDSLAGLKPEEAAVLAFLRKRLEQQTSQL